MEQQTLYETLRKTAEVEEPQRKQVAMDALVAFVQHNPDVREVINSGETISFAKSFSVLYESRILAQSVRGFIALVASRKKPEVIHIK